MIRSRSLTRNGFAAMKTGTGHRKEVPALSVTSNRTDGSSNYDRFKDCVTSKFVAKDLSRVQREERVKKLLSEIKKEKPLCNASMHDMPLTFGSFVWCPFLDNFYREDREEVDSKVQAGKQLHRSNSASCLKANINISNRAPSQDSTSGPSPVPATPQVAKKDMIRMNMLSVTRGEVKLRSSKTTNRSELLSTRSHKMGAVPKYLSERKEKKAREEEQRLKSLPDPDCPKGHVQMPEAERLETLNKLRKNQDELIGQLNCLPISQDTLRIRQKREDIENQLMKVEQGIAILSKAKVFVKIE